MKGMVGLIIAAGLGLLAVALNWVYLTQKTEGTNSVSFIGVRQGVTIKAGDYIKESQIVEVKIPENHAKSLKKLAYSYRDIKSVVNMFPVARTLVGGDLVLHQDYRTAPVELKYQGDYNATIVVPIDTSRVVTALIDPGDQIYFIAPKLAKPDQGQDDLIGPFTVAAVGSRLGSRQAARGTGRSRMQERQITVFIKLVGKTFDGEAKKLNAEIITSGGRGMGVLPFVPAKK
jgi:hypothetical protein